MKFSGIFIVTIVNAIKGYFNYVLQGDYNEEKVSHTPRELASMKRLTDAKITRFLVKKAIMTTPYGVKYYSMASYIIGDLIFSDTAEGNTEIGEPNTVTLFKIPY